jgi:hypothetical protein
VEANDGLAFSFVNEMHPEAIAIKIAWCEWPGTTKGLALWNHG